MTPQKVAEARRVTAIFHAALVMLGFRALAEALQLWRGVSAEPAQQPYTSGRWLADVLGLRTARRRHARDLAFTYYRLNRALHTGATIDDPFRARPDERSVPLGDLRKDFLDAVETYAPEALGGDEVSVPGKHEVDSEDFSDVPDLESDLSDEERIELEEIEALEDELRREELAEEIRDRVALEATGTSNLERKLSEIRDKDQAGNIRPVAEISGDRMRAHSEAGFRQAAELERSVLDAARDSIITTSRLDPRVIGWVRISRTGTPCGWCAMLISRKVFFKSEASASVGPDDEDGKFHTNCRCVAIPIYSQEQFDTDPMFDLNREYAALWPEVTRGLSGKAARKAWRRYFRYQQATQVVA